MGILDSSIARVTSNRPLSFEHACLDHPATLGDTTDHGNDTGPTPDDAAEWLGYSLLLDGEYANPGREMPFPQMAMFYRGWYAARMDIARELDADRNAWIAWADTLNDDDRIESRSQQPAMPYED